MHEHVITADVNETAKNCAIKMTKERVGCIIIVQNDSPVGIITERGFADLVARGTFDANKVIAGDFMTTQLITVTTDTDYATAIEVFNRENIKRVPVLENSKVVGLLTLKNMVEYSQLTIDLLDEENQLLKNEAHCDPLTGLLNKKALNELLVKEFFRIKSEGGRSSVLFLDIDHFKLINDDFSHIAGDAVLKELSEIIKEFSRETDHVCRFGGEEFVIIARNQKKYHSLKFAERLREIIHDHPFEFKGANIPVTVSIGVTGLFASRDYSLTLERADAAMYFAKQNGRNCVGYYKGNVLKVLNN